MVASDCSVVRLLGLAVMLEDLRSLWLLACVDLCANQHKLKSLHLCNDLVLWTLEWSGEVGAER